jgi:TrmH family RNA methyltransferase
MSEALYISSRQNPRVKALAKLREASARRETGRFLIEGLRELERAFENNIKLHTLYFCESLFRGEAARHWVERVQASGVETIPVTPEVFDKLSHREGPDGLLAEAGMWSTGLDRLQLSAAPLVLVVEAVEKPGNLGALLRSADAAGVEAVVVCDPVTDIFNPNVVRASQGVVFGLPVAVAATDTVDAFLKQRGIRTIATTPAAETLLWDVPMQGAVAILMGSEKDGLSDYWLNRADARVKIPLAGKADSLNVAAAAVITLFEAVRQRRPG